MKNSGVQKTENHVDPRRLLKLNLQEALHDITERDEMSEVTSMHDRGTFAAHGINDKLLGLEDSNLLNSQYDTGSLNFSQMDFTRDPSFLRMKSEMGKKTGERVLVPHVTVYQ